MTIDKIKKAIEVGAVLGVIAGTAITIVVANEINEKLNITRKENLELIDKLSVYDKMIAEADKQITELETVINFIENNNIPPMTIKKITVGIQNRNPMNVWAMGKSNPWEGQIGKDDQGHAIFSSFEYGLRAGAKVLINYHSNGINSIDKLIDKYCTGNHNQYKTFLSKQLGVSVKQKINILVYLPKIMKAMVRFENGYDVFPDTAYIPYSIYK